MGRRYDMIRCCSCLMVVDDVGVVVRGELRMKDDCGIDEDDAR